MERRIWLRGLGIYLPESSLTNAEIEAGMPWLQTSAQWISEHTGILKRHVARKDQTAVDIGYLAAREALDHAGVEPEAIDLVLLATNTSEYVYPAGAGLIQAAFGTDESGNLRMKRAGALDVQQGCSSFLGAIGMAAGMLRGGAFERILVVGADVATRMVDWTDRNAILLGDAATACVLEAGSRPTGLKYPPFEVLSHFMRTDASKSAAIAQLGVLNPENDPFDHIGRELESGDGIRAQMYGKDFFGSLRDEEHRFFRMDGRQVYRFAKGVVPRQGYLEVLRRAGLTGDMPERFRDVESVDDVREREARVELCRYLATKVDMFVPHSANLSLNQEIADEMEIPWERMYITLNKYGNTSAASVGLSLYEALRQESCYTSLTKRDGTGAVKVEGREIRVAPLKSGAIALLVSFGAGNSWNYITVRCG